MLVKLVPSSGWKSFYADGAGLPCASGRPIHERFRCRWRTTLDSFLARRKSRQCFFSL